MTPLATKVTSHIEVNYRPSETYTTYQAVTSKTSPDILQIEVVYPEHNEITSYTEVVNIHKSRDVLDLLNKIKDNIKKEGKWSADIQDVKLIYKNAIASSDQSLAGTGIDRNCRVTVIYELIQPIARSQTRPVEH